MFLRATTRKKDGKEHRYFSVVENRRVAGGRVLQRHVFWRKSIEVLEDGERVPRSLALFPEDHCEGLAPDASIVRLRLSQLSLCRPRQWGACWLALTLWQELRLDEFWGERLAPSRKGTRWDRVLFVLAAYRLIAPGSEWRLHREWFGRTALADLLGADESLADSHALYACRSARTCWTASVAPGCDRICRLRNRTQIICRRHDRHLGRRLDSILSTRNRHILTTRSTFC